MYAHRFAAELDCEGLSTEVVTCGLVGITAHHLAAGRDDKALRDIQKLVCSEAVYFLQDHLHPHACPTTVEILILQAV